MQFDVQRGDECCTKLLEVMEIYRTEIFVALEEYSVMPFKNSKSAIAIKDERVKVCYKLKVKAQSIFTSRRFKNIFSNKCLLTRLKGFCPSNSCVNSSSAPS